MRQFFCIFVALQLVAGTTAVSGVLPWAERPAEHGPVVPADSAALFVGIRDFEYDPTLADVKYAVDDAVDLAYAIAMSGDARLVEPKRVVLALSGDPQKPESARHLEALVAAGASIKSAKHADILFQLENQSRAVGENGILIVGFATHGVNDEGIQHLLTRDSILRQIETTISEVTVREIVSRARVPRALIIIDACRQRLTSDQGNGGANPRSAAALMRKLSDVNGMVVLAAAAPGDYAFDDDTLRNGVFTAAVIDGLRCQARTDVDGFVTVDTLSNYVERRVLNWIQKNRDPKATRATQLHSEGKSRAMPLSICAR